MGARLHDVFHVGLLKKYCKATPTGSGFLSLIRHGHACLEHAEVSKCHITRDRHEVLVRWTRQSAANATWIPLDKFRATYPTFQLRDEPCLQGGRDVMWGIQYNHCAK
jgi:hypothetical protein